MPKIDTYKPQFLSPQLAQIWGTLTTFYCLAWCTWAALSQLGHPNSWISDVASPLAHFYLVNPGWALLGIALLMFPFKRTAGFGGVCAFTCARLWISALWIVAAGYCTILWGKPALVIGALMAGGGVFVVAGLATILSGAWVSAGVFAANALLVWFANALGIWSISRWSSQFTDTATQEPSDSQRSRIDLEDEVWSIILLLEDSTVDDSDAKRIVDERYPQRHPATRYRLLKHAYDCLNGYAAPANLPEGTDEAEYFDESAYSNRETFQKLQELKGKKALLESKMGMMLFRMNESRLEEGNLYDAAEARIKRYEAAALVHRIGGVLADWVDNDTSATDTINEDSIEMILDAFKVVYIARWGMDRQGELLSKALEAIANIPFFEEFQSIPSLDDSGARSDGEREWDDGEPKIGDWSYIPADWSEFTSSVDDQMRGIEDESVSKSEDGAGTLTTATDPYASTTIKPRRRLTRE